MKRVAWVFFGGLLTLVIVGLVASAWLTSEAGTRYLAAKLEANLAELTLSGVTGSLRQGVRIDRLEWKDSSVEVRVTSLYTQLDLEKLPFTLALRSVSAESLNIVVSESEPKAEPDLPTVATPITIAAKKLRLETLAIQSGDTLVEIRDLSTSLHWLGARMTLTGYQLRLFDTQFSGEGFIVLRDNYALQSQLQIRNQEYSFQARADISGDLRKSRIALTTTSPWAVVASTQLDLMEDGLPFTLKASLAESISDSTLGINLDQALVTLSGNLHEGQGKLSALILHDTIGPITATTDIHWNLQALNAELALLAEDNGSIRSHCNASRDLARIDCESQIAHINLAPLDAGLTSSLNAGITFNWQQSEGAAIQLRGLRGSWQSRPVSGAAEVNTHAWEQWEIIASQLVVADQRLRAQGQLGKQTQLSIQLDLTDLAQLNDGASGQLYAEANVSGDWHQPRIQLTASATGAAWDAVALETAQLKLDIRDWGRGRSVARLSLDALTWGDIKNDLEFSMNSSADLYQLRLDMTGATPISARCDMRGDPLQDLTLRCDTVNGEIHSELVSLEWHMANTLAVSIREQFNTITIEPVCLSADEARICLQAPITLKQDKLATAKASLTNIPLRWFERAWPTGLQLSNNPRLNGEANFTEQDLSMKLTLDASEWLINLPEQSQKFVLDPSTLTVAAKDKQIKTSLAVNGDLGDFVLDLTLQGLASNAPISGQLTLEGLNLSALTWLSPDIETLSGKINAALQIKGSRGQPQLFGSIDLTQGALGLTPLPFELQNLSGGVRLDGQHGSLTARMRADQGNAELSGQFGLPAEDQPWSLSAAINARSIRVEPLPDSSLTTDADLQLRLGPSGGELTGEVGVQQAHILLRALPDSAYDVSPDVVLVQEQERSRWSLATELQIDLGPEFRFEGFGAAVELEGQLRYLNDAQRSHYGFGEVSIGKGRYRAYGQRLIVQRGSFLFNGPLDDPNIFIEAVRERLPPDVVAGMRVRGSLQNPHAELFSQPSMPETDIAYYVLTGKPPTKGTGGEFSAGSTLLSLGLAGSNKPAAELAERFGIRDLELSADTTEQGVETEVSAYLTPKLQVRYGHGMSDNSSTITLQYRLSKNLVVEAISGAAQALDFLYTFEINRRPEQDDATKADKAGEQAE